MVKLFAIAWEIEESALAYVAQLAECHPVHQRSPV